MWWVTCLIWSTVWLAIKIGVHDLPPLSFAGWRLVLALVLLTPIFLAKPHLLREITSNWRLIAATGFLLLGVNYALVFWGAQYVSSGLTAVLQATTPVFGVCFAFVMARESIRRNEVIGVVVGLLGIVLIFSGQLRSAANAGLLGSVAVVSGAACVAFTYVFIGSRGKHISPLPLAGGQMFVGCIPLVVAGAMLEGNPLRLHWTRPAIYALIYLAVAGSIFGFYLNYWLLKRVGSTSVLTISSVEPLFAVILGAIVLHETLTWRVAIGGLAVLSSATLILMRRKAES